MALAQISPTTVVANPANVNPLAHTNYNVSAAAAGSMAQKKSDRAKSDSVTISRQALEKSAKSEEGTEKAKDALTQEAAQQTARK